jgi:hypothetical protein
VIAGFALLFDYSSKAGLSAQVPPRCPDSIVLDPSRPTLLLFVHPKCPCTSATMNELDRLAAQAGGRLRITVFVLSDPAFGEDVGHGQLWRRGAVIPGVDMREDPAGAIARTLGANTSGEAVVFAPDRRLLFEGGITGARGHEGDNAGRSAILQLALGRQPACTSTPVYGCSLRTEPVMASGKERT